MSKSNNNDSDISSKYIDFLINAIGDTNASIQALSNSYKNSLREQRKNYEDLIKAFNKGEVSSEKLAKGFAQALKTVQSVDYGMRRTERYNDSAKDFFDKLAKEIDGKKITETLLDKIESALTNLDMTALTQSYKENEKGTKNALFKNVKDNDKLKDVNTDLANKIGAKLDDNLFKLITFMGRQDKEKEKKTRGFVDDLIDGLAKNKFIGGALNDTFRLIGLIGGRFFSQFGQLGKILGAAFYIAMETAGPLFVSLFLKGTGKLIGSLGSLLLKGGSNLFKGLLGKTLKSPTTTKALDAETMRYLMFPKATDVTKSGLDVIKGAGATAKVAKTGLTLGKAIKGVPGLGALFEVLGDIPALIDAKKQGGGAFGKQVLKTGGGAVGTIVGGILGSALGPLGTIVGSILGGFIGRGIGMLIGAVGDWFKKLFRIKDEEKEENTNKQNWWQNFINWIKNAWENRPKILGGKGSDSKDMGQQLGIPQSRADEKSNIKGSTSFGKLKVAKDGAILNLSDLSQVEASKQLQAYEKADPTAFGKVYEWAGSDVARLGSFQTDAAKLNANGQATGALMYKGASQDLKDLRSKVYNNLISQGYSEERAQTLVNNLMYTSGRMTGSNTQHRGKGKWKSHDNVYGFGFDIGGGVTWSEKDYKAAEGAVKEFYRGKGLQVAYEGAGQGKSTGKHWDIKPIKNMRAKGAEELLGERSQEQKAQAEQHTIEAGEVLYNTLGKEELERVTREGIKKGKTQEEMGQLYEEELRKKGVRQESDKSWVQDIGSGKTRVLVDPHGNRTFENFSYMSKGANLGFE